LVNPHWLKFNFALMTDRVKDKVVIVTGGAQGIGFGVAEMLASEGARVVIADKNADAGPAAAKRIANAVFQRCDVTSEADCIALIQSSIHLHKRLDGLINNVGWFPRATIEDTTTEFWEAVMNVNVRGAMYCCKHAIPELQKAGGGSVVNVGSVHGIQSYANLIAYGAAKGALLTMTRSLAAAYAPDRIRFNYLIPGWVMSEGETALAESRGNDVAALRAMGDQQTLGRHQTPQDTAYAIVYLLSDESAQVTGTTMHIDAGMSSLTWRERRMG
jgi:NAD(P)-dependent dehydrogenase (short-subunit alcohol dehydrogenase family)